MLVIGVLGLAAAALAAWFTFPAYREYRARPDLMLLTEPGGSSTSAASRDVGFRLILHNAGKGNAVDWKVRIGPCGARGVHQIRNANPAAGPQGWTTRGNGEAWRIEWGMAGSDDAIGPGLDRTVRVGTTSFLADETLAFPYSIVARRMKPREGEVRVTFPEGGQPGYEVA